jgi:hypothetical protein
METEAERSIHSDEQYVPVYMRVEIRQSSQVISIQGHISSAGLGVGGTGAWDGAV